MGNDARKLTINGTAQTMSSVNDKKIISSHTWSKIIELPENVDKKSLKAKMMNFSLEITANFISKEIPIPISIK